jgi:hypothetical protein
VRKTRDIIRRNYGIGLSPWLSENATILSWHSEHQILVNLNASIYTLLMISERPKRDRKPKVVWEAVESPSTASRPKTAVQKASRTVKTDALTPVAVEPLSRPSKLDQPLPVYTPPFQIKKKRGKPSFEGLSAIETFQKFINCDIIGRIGIAINAYATRARAKQSSDEY